MSLPAGSTPTQVPRLSLTQSEAAEALGLSLSSFKRHVAADLPVVRRGAVRLYPVAELVRWLEQNAERTLERRAA